MVASAATVTVAVFAAIFLPRAFLLPFTEGTFTILMLFNPGILQRPV